MQVSIKMTVSILVIIFVLLLGYVWTRLKVIKLTYDYTMLIEEEKKVLEENRILRLELAKLISPQRLNTLAKEKFKMSKNPKNTIVYNVKLENAKK